MDKNDKKIYIIDGNNFTNINEFYDEIENKLIGHKIYWGRNLDAFNDILRGCFGNILDDNFIILWKNSNISKQKFEYFYEIIDIITNKNNSGHENVELILN